MIIQKILISHVSIQSQILLNYNPKSFTMPSPITNLLQLTVFRYGLQLGLVTVADVVKWADKIITDDPDYFFVELLLATTETELVTLINEKIKPEPGSAVARVLLGLLHHLLNNGQIDFRKGVDIMNQINSWRVLDPHELGEIYQLDDEFYEKFMLPAQHEAEVRILDFLSTYKAYSIDDPESWSNVPAQGDANEATQIEYIKITPDDQTPLDKYSYQQHAVPKQRFTLSNLKPAFIVLVGVVVIGGLYVLLDGPTSQTDQVGNSPKLWLIPICFYIGRMVYKIAGKN